MKHLIDILAESLVMESVINEGGASGHMAHVIDYTDYDMESLKELVNALFGGEVKGISEKLDGTNIQATMNRQGEVRFIRNKGDLNNPEGGMSVSDMALKWASKPHIANTFVTAGKTIQEVFNKIGPDFFNPDENTRIIANCECLVAGVTNIIPYASTQVDFHNLWYYSFNGNEWVHTDTTKKGLEVLQKACEGMDNAQLTPEVVIEISSKSHELAEQYKKDIENLFKTNITIDEWREDRFIEYVDNNDLSWINDSDQGVAVLYNRFFNEVKSVNLREIKKFYPGHEDEIDQLCKKGYKEIVANVIEPLDTLFLRLGNDIISLCKGLINDGYKDQTVSRLVKDLDDMTRDIRKNGTVELNDKLSKQLNRLQRLGNQINPTEGIVFMYKGKLQKLTGSFAPLNRALGLKYEM